MTKTETQNLLKNHTCKTCLNERHSDPSFRYCYKGQEQHEIPKSQTCDSWIDKYGTYLGLYVHSKEELNELLADGRDIESKENMLIIGIKISYTPTQEVFFSTRFDRAFTARPGDIINVAIDKNLSKYLYDNIIDTL